MDAELYESLPTSSVAVHMTAGAFAGIMEHCVMYPLDSVKTRMQALIPGPGGGGGVGAVLTRMVRQEGLLRPIRGVGVMVVGAGPAHALYFSCYEYIKNKFTRVYTEFNPLVYGMAGCVATLLHDGVMNPAEVVKQRLQMYNSPYRNVLSCIRHVYETEGAYAFYRSYTTQLAMNVPFQSIHFIAYEVAQVFTNPDHVYSPIAHMVSGALAGAVAAGITTPLDVCKTLLNTQNGIQAQGMVDAFKKVYAFGGIKGYFRGINARVLYQMPATAICWSTYEFFKYTLCDKTDDDYRPTEIVENNDAVTTNQNQTQTGTSTRTNRFQNIGLVLNKNAPSVLLKLTS